MHRKVALLVGGEFFLSFLGGSSTQVAEFFCLPISMINVAGSSFVAETSPLYLPASPLFNHPLSSHGHCCVPSINSNFGNLSTPNPPPPPPPRHPPQPTDPPPHHPHPPTKAASRSSGVGWGASCTSSAYWACVSLRWVVGDWRVGWTVDRFEGVG